MKFRLVVLALALLLPLAAQATPFEQGKIHLSIGGGTVSSGSDTGIVIGGGIGYMILDGLELGLDSDYWTGIEPGRFTLSPQARYWLDLGFSLFPYVGTFFSHSFVDSPYEDLQSYGFRGGAAWLSGRGLYLTFGWAAEKYIKGSYEKDWINYPEIAFGLSF